LGPLLFAPLSEVYGRKLAVLTPYFLAAIFSFATAVSKDLQTVLITRFFAGFFGSAPVTNTGGVLGDLWAPEQRGVAIVGYAMAVVGGPVFGPIIGGALTMDVNWRWTQYVSSDCDEYAIKADVRPSDNRHNDALLSGTGPYLR
jgi:MFS family permease